MTERDGPARSGAEDPGRRRTIPDETSDCPVGGCSLRLLQSNNVLLNSTLMHP